MKSIEKRLKVYELLINLGINIECSDEWLKCCKDIVRDVLSYIEMEEDRRLLNK